MFLRLVFLFVLTPLVELGVLVYLGTVIGVLYTILIVIGTGTLGAILARHEGLTTVSRIRSSIQSGIVPSNELFEGALIVGGGLLLLTPGILTDLVGFAVLVPQTRGIIGKWLRSMIRHRIEKGEIHYWEAQ